MDSYEGKFKVYLITDSERHWFVAESMADAVRLYFGVYGFSDDDLGGPLTIDSVSPQTEITVEFEYENPAAKKTKTAAQWAFEATEQDMLCSSVY